MHAVKSLPLAVSLILSTVAAVGDDRQKIRLPTWPPKPLILGLPLIYVRQHVCFSFKTSGRPVYLYSAARTPWGQDAFLEAKCLWKQLLNMYS